MTVWAPVQVNGNGSASYKGGLYGNTPGNNVTWAGPITVASDSQFRVVNANVKMNLVNVQGTNVNLECTAASTTADTNTVMTFQNTLSLGNGTLTR